MTDKSQTGPNRQAEAKRYEKRRLLLFGLRFALGIGALASLVLSGVSQELAEYLRGRFHNPWIVTSLYAVAFVLGYTLLMFPLTLYGDFTLEHRYGLSRQGVWSWFADLAKALAIDLVIFALLIDVVYFLLRSAPQSWWLWAALFYAAFSVVLARLYPVLVMPIFHKLEPIADGELQRAVTEFATRAGMKVLGVYRWGLSAKTATGNAALTGLGRTRRIVLGDTLLEGYEHDEILSVIAHEVAHYVNRDLWRLLAIGTVVIFAGFAATSVLLQRLVLSFGIRDVADIGGLPLLVLSMALFAMLTMPLSNACTRRCEYAADAYVADTAGLGAALASALDKLAGQNLSDKTPHPALEFLFHSHPSIEKRIRAIRARVG